MRLLALRRRAQRLPPVRRRIALLAIALTLLALVINMILSFASNMLLLHDMRQEHPRMYSLLQWYIPAALVLVCFCLLAVLLWDDPLPIQVAGAAPIPPGAAKKAEEAASLTLRRLFLEDFDYTLRSWREINLRHKDVTPLKILGQLYQDFPARSMFAGFFIPRSPNTYQACLYLVDDYKAVMAQVASGSTITGGFVGEQTKQEDLAFTGRVYIYHESALTLEEIVALRAAFREKGADVHFRGDDYLTLKMIAVANAPESGR